MLQYFYLYVHRSVPVPQPDAVAGKDIPVLFAGVVLCMIPAITLFVVFQDKFLNLSFGGGIKG